MTSASPPISTRETGPVVFDVLPKLRARLNAALRGKDEIVERVLVCLLAGGHLLLEDRPGLGKTTLAKALADALGGEFARIQCTPDLLPADVTGFSIYNQKSHEFEFRRGPVFADVLLADEINRATPRTQSALLEAMAERQVTVDAVRYPLSPEFFVIATQNPTEQHGTFPLPQAQLDRFAMKVSIGYPGQEDEVAMLAHAVGSDARPATDAGPLLNDGDLRGMQQAVAGVYVAPGLHRWLVELAAATRSHPAVRLGLSPRGLLCWQRLAQGLAALRGRTFVTPDDILDVAGPALLVRLECDTDEPRELIGELLASLDVPLDHGSRTAGDAASR